MEEMSPLLSFVPCPSHMDMPECCILVLWNSFRLWTERRGVSTRQAVRHTSFKPHANSTLPSLASVQGGGCTYLWRHKKQIGVSGSLKLVCTEVTIIRSWANAGVSEGGLQKETVLEWA